MKEDIKKCMLKEFEKQIDEIMLNANESNFDQTMDFINNHKNCWNLYRFDLQNRGNNFNRVNILDNPAGLSINFPDWFRDNYGQGCKIQGNARKSSLKFQCENNGSLKVFLRGVDYRNPDGLRVPVYVNFTNFQLNDQLIFSGDNLICHDEPYVFEISSKNKDVFDIYLEFESIFDYYPFLSDLFDNVVNIEDLKTEYYLFKKQLQFMRFLGRFDKFDNCSLEMYDFMKNDNQLSLRGNEKNLFTYNFFLNNYTNYLTFLEINNKLNQLHSKIKSLENKMKSYNRIIDSDNALFNSIFLDYKLTPNSLLYNVQTLCLELLSFVNKICQKYDIKWWLDFGTLLGAIRHENFIPWDDDIDIGIMRKDYHKFIEVMFDELEKNNLSNYIDVVYRWRKHDGKEVNGSLHFFVRDEKVGKNVILAAVDFIPYDFMRDYDSNTFGISYNHSLKNFYQMLCRGDDTSTLYMGLDYSDIIDEYFKELNLTYNEDKYIVPGVEGPFAYGGKNLYELIVLNYSHIFPLKESKFREYIFPVPNDSIYYLKQIYGNSYMEIPKDIRTHSRLSIFRDVPNINEIFEEYIVVLKEANKNFKY